MLNEDLIGIIDEDVILFGNIEGTLYLICLNFCLDQQISYPLRFENELVPGSTPSSI